MPSFYHRPALCATPAPAAFPNRQQNVPGHPRAPMPYPPAPPATAQLQATRWQPQARQIVATGNPPQPRRHAPVGWLPPRNNLHPVTAYSYCPRLPTSVKMNASSHARPSACTAGISSSASRRFPTDYNRPRPCPGRRRNSGRCRWPRRPVAPLSSTTSARQPRIRNPRLIYPAADRRQPRRISARCP